MKSIQATLQDIKREYKEEITNKVFGSYSTLSDYEDRNILLEVSPDTRKQVENKTGKFSWFHTIKDKLKQKNSTVDLLGFEKAEVKRVSYSEKLNIVKEIINNDILTTYPLFRTEETISQSIKSVNSSYSRIKTMGTKTLEEVTKQLNDTINSMERFSGYHINCKEVVSNYKLLYNSSADEDKKYIIKEMVKLRDTLLSHQIEMNGKVGNTTKTTQHTSFTSSFLNSEYSLTEEEAIWWNKNKAPAFIEKEAFKSLGVSGGDIESFIRWKQQQSQEFIKENLSNKLKQEEKEALEKHYIKQNITTPVNDHIINQKVQSKLDLYLKKHYISEYTKHEVIDLLNDISSKLEYVERMTKYKNYLKSVLPEDLIEEYLVWQSIPSNTNAFYHKHIMNVDNIGKKMPELYEGFLAEKMSNLILDDLVSNAIDFADNRIFYDHEIALIGGDGDDV